MATVDDQATDREERDRELALKMRKPELVRTGVCYNCGAATDGIYCDTDCGMDYEQRIRFNR